mgnify:CR=1 FL=1
MKKLLHTLLRLLAQRILQRHEPRIVAITGSVGKTSAKTAIAGVLSKQFTVRAGESSFNNEIGVPLAIIGIAESPGKNMLGWVGVVVKGVRTMLAPKGRYPQILVLEFGADHPGDIRYLMESFPPSISVLTAVAKVHLEQFRSIENVAREKSLIISLLPPSGKAIINADDPLVAPLARKTSVAVTTFGTSEAADFSATALQVVDKEGIIGLAFKIGHGGRVVPLFIPSVTGGHHVYAMLAAAAVADAVGMNLVDIGNALADYRTPRGRGRLIDGIGGALIVDDTYNASPISTKAALHTLASLGQLRGGKTIAILGDMLELGDYMDQGHREVGRVVKELGIDILLTVGELASRISKSARDAGISEDSVHAFVSREQAIDFVRPQLTATDTILVKGSQGARMEKVVVALMAHPEQAGELVVRQSAKWKKK